MCNLFNAVFVTGDVSDYIFPCHKTETDLGALALLTVAFSFIFADSVTPFLFCQLKIKAREWNALQPCQSILRRRL